MSRASSPRWQAIIAEELKKKGSERLDIPRYENILLEAISELLTAERQNLSQGGFPIQQSTKRIVSALADNLEKAEVQS